MFNLTPEDPNFEDEIQLWFAEAVTAEEQAEISSFLERVGYHEEVPHYAEDAYLDDYYDSQWELGD